MENRKRSFLVIAAVLGLSGGLLQGGGKMHRAPSNAPPEAPKALLSYRDLPCPSDEVYRSFAASLHLDLPSGGNFCNDPTHGPLSKLLLEASSLKIHLPPDWAPDLKSDLEDPLGFLGRSSSHTGFDFSQVESIAYNRSGEIFLGGLFFRELPLEALSTLMHESRHSSKNDPGHVTCRRGDIPKTPGGCDEELSLDPAHAGAYSYGAAFYAALGLYAEGLSDADREYLLSAALATVWTRFNVLPPELARSYDLVALLDKAGAVSLLHPFLKEPIPLAVPGLTDGEKVERIELNVRNDGLLLLTTRHRAYTWSPSAGFSRLYADVLTNSLAVLDAARIRVPFSDYPYYNFLTNDREIQYYVFDTRTLSYVLSPYPTFPAGAPIPELKGLFMGLAARSLFLGRDGRLFAGQRWADEAPFDARGDLQVPGQPWTQATGGVVFESLYGITADGRAQFTLTDPGDEAGSEKYQLSESIFQVEGGARKLLEGLTFRALLGADGTLHFETYDRQQRSVWNMPNAPAADFAILRNHVVTAPGTSGTVDSGLKQRCGLRTAIPDPWFGLGLGLDFEGHLVIGLPSGDCAVVGTETYKDVHLEERALKAPRAESHERQTPWGDSEPLARDSLRLTNGTGATVTIRPYDFR